jgi:hypothetical protein
MNTNLKALASLVLVSALTAGFAQTTDGTSTSSKKTATRRKAPAKPSVESQIEELRSDMNAQRGQIDTLKQQLADRDAQLQQAQQAAAAAQAAAQQAQQAAQSQQAAISENTQSVSSLQGAVTDLKSNNQSLVTTLQDNQAQVKKEFENPDSIHFKGVTLSPTGSFIEFATVDRTRALAADINTPFTSIPFSTANAGNISEFFASGRQSRVALLVQGKVPNATLRGYYEADWLGTGVTSNNNESNSYVMRQRQIWAQGQFNNGWVITGGQQWSLATPYQKGLINRNEWIPLTIDAAYTNGFIWERQPGFRVVKIFSPALSLGVAAEQAQTLAPTCNAAGPGACPVNYLIGATGTNGGLYNGAGAPGATSSAPVTTYSYNVAPDLIAKVALDKPYGHFELFGISRFFRDRVFPNEVLVTTTNPITGVKTVTVGGSSAGAYNDRTVGGGVGGSAHYLAYQKKINIGIEGLYGDGTQRYGDAQVPDITLRPDGQLALLHGFSALGSVEANVTPRLQLYAYYGGDYVGRNIFYNATGGEEGYGLYNNPTSGCGTEPLPGTTATTTPTGSMTGYSPATPGSCSVNTKDSQEVTVGWWFDIYRGEFGRLRQGFQYSWAERNTWSGVNGLSPKGIDNMFFTSFRYYLP